MSETDTYLEATEAIDCDSEAIQGLAKDLTSGCVSDEEKAVKLFYFVRDSIRYNIYMISAYLEDFKASTVLARGKGYCVQKAVLLTALGRAAGDSHQAGLRQDQKLQSTPQPAGEDRDQYLPRPRLQPVPSQREMGQRGGDLRQGAMPEERTPARRVQRCAQCPAA